jgi:hypothetical protein
MGRRTRIAQNINQGHDVSAVLRLIVTFSKELLEYELTP